MDFHRVDILALAVGAARRDEADAGKNARSLPQRDIGDRVLQPVDEARDREADVAMLIFAAYLRADELFGSRSGFAAVASSPARNGRNNSLRVGIRQPR